MPLKAWQKNQIMHHIAKLRKIAGHAHLEGPVNIKEEPDDDCTDLWYEYYDSPQYDSDW